MASSSHNPTSPDPTQWDVFLSFRGEDTRHSFTDHLYRALTRVGIRTFRDDPELRSGEVISRALPQAIHESMIYIVVFSENYAASSWCLEELVEILACYKRMKRLVIPVFYHIDPSVIRHQTASFQQDIDPSVVGQNSLDTILRVFKKTLIHPASFQKAFEKHKTRFDLEKINKWRLTLKEVADFSGYHISKNRSQAVVIDEVVNRISLEINPKALYVAKYPVGLDSRIKDITELMNSDAEGVIRIGMHGMGGVGKTTLAKAVYNQNYQRFQGSCFLANVREVSGTENGLVGLQRQLIVDVLKCNNFEIGSKDQGIELIRARIGSTKVLIVIDDLDNPKPLEYLEGSFALGSVIVITTRNEDLLDGIKVKAKYKVNEMNKDESRQLFTHHAFGEHKISDAFTGLSKEILERVGGLPLALQVSGAALYNKSEEGWRHFIERLKQDSINGVEEKLRLSFEALKLVDPYLQNIFLDIACFFIGKQKDMVFRILETCYEYVDYYIDILKKRCLITFSELRVLGMHDLLCDMGRNIARNNCPDEPGKHSRLWVSENVHTVLKNNKGTEAIQGIISGEFNDYYDPKVQEVEFDAESFKRMSKLRLLYLSNVNITGSFEKTFEDLRWLRWAYCPLEYLPSEFYPQKLLILELPYSKMKAKWERNMVPRVFEKLKTLNMRHSSNLTTTPDFTRLPCLQRLDLSWCESLEEVHVSIGSLVSLVSLDLGHCENLRSLPDSICSLRALEVLDISECANLVELPDQLGMLTSLRRLNVFGATMLKKIPDISQLSNIDHLNVSHYHHLLSILELPPNLKQLWASTCRSLKRLPDLSNLKQLEILNLEECTVLTEIKGLEELTCLRELVLDCCHDLRSISGLPPNLKFITAVYCRSLKRLPDLSNLKQLETLNLQNCQVLTEIQGLEELTCLRELILDRCIDLRSISGLPPDLKWVSAKGCRSLKWASWKLLFTFSA